MAVPSGSRWSRSAVAFRTASARGIVPERTMFSASSLCIRGRTSASSAAVIGRSRRSGPPGAASSSGPSSGLVMVAEVTTYPRLS